MKIDDSAIFDWAPTASVRPLIYVALESSLLKSWISSGVVIFCSAVCSPLLRWLHWVSPHFYCRRVNVSHFGDPSQCWNELLTQRTYVILLQPHYGHHHDALFKARYDDPLGAAIEFTTETERKLQKALGNNFPLLLQQNYNIDFPVLLLSEFR